jgi:DNA-3-methyladenine glycosylase I
MKTRCAWTTTDEQYIRYHDEEWGVPVFDDRILFEFLILEGAQAGLSWITILKKRERYREVMDAFDPDKIAAYGPDKISELLADPGIIRNRLKLAAAVKNANAFLRVREEFGTFSAYIWSFVGGKPRVNHWEHIKEVPAQTAESDAMSRDLKKRGFSFVGSTICYAFMQATGMVMDHNKDCYRYSELVEQQN